LLQLLAVALEIGPRWADQRKSIRFSNGCVEAMLGQCPWLIGRICEAVLLAIPSSPRMNVADAFSVVGLIVEDTAKSLNCSCRIEMCRYANGREERESKGKFYGSKCPRRKLWDIVGTCLRYGLICFLVNVGPNTSVIESDYCLIVKSILYCAKSIHASSYGEHSNLRPAITEGLSELEMKQSNSVAQLLALDPGERMLLLQGCCLNCAFQRPKEDKIHIMIVT
jgi:hypothetical protein